MTDTEWQEIERQARETARRTVREIFESEAKAALQEEKERQRADGQQRKRELDRAAMRAKELIREGLERYRSEPSGENVRDMIDYLLKRHAQWESHMSHDRLFRKRHNAIVLKYVIKEPMDDKTIQEKLGMKESVYRNQSEKCMYELAQIFIS